MNNNDLLNDILEYDSTVINNVILLNIDKLNMTSDEFLMYTVLKMFSQRGLTFPSSENIKNVTGMIENDILKIIQSMIQKNFISIKTKINKNHQQYDIYDLKPIYTVLNEIISEKRQYEDNQNKQDKKVELFRMFEVEFGRALSPIEQETIHDWIEVDGYDIELIKLALKESILNQVYSLKYLDRILLNWEKQNIKTPVQLEEFKRRNEY